MDVYSILFNKIISGELPEGTRLKEESIATEYNVSRTPVRAVLQQLEQDGLIQIEPNKGARVLPFSADEIEEIYEIRKALELVCLDIAGASLSMHRLLELKKEILNLGSNNDVNYLTMLDYRLHSFIITSTGKKRLIDMLEQLSRLIQSFRGLGFTKKESTESAIREHLEIINALTKRDLFKAKDPVETKYKTAKQ